MKKLTYHITFYLAILLALPVQAKIVPNLYQALVPVSSQAESVRSQAVNTAFQQVLVRVSGNSQVLQNDTVQTALANPSQYMQQYSYTQQPLTGPEATNNPGATQLMLQVIFDASQIKTLLQQADQPIWGRDRPTLLVWAAQGEGDGQQRKFLDVNNPSQSLQMLQQIAKLRGLPLVWPAVPQAQTNEQQQSQSQQSDQSDVADASNASADAAQNNTITLDDVWQPNLQNIQQFSQTYGADAIVVVRLNNDDNQWQGQWTLLLNGQRFVWQSSADDEWTAVQQGMTNVADAMGQQFAVDDGTQKKNTATITITNLGSLGGFVTAQKYLQQLTPVQQVELVQMDANAAQFSITYEGTQSDLIKAIKLDNKLLIIQPDDSDFKSTLNYQWQ